MSYTLLIQNSEILSEVAENYEKFLANTKKTDKNFEPYVKNFRSQFLYLLTSIHTIVKKEKKCQAK